MTEALARLEDLKKENATLRSENERLRGQLSSWDLNYALKCDLPSADQALALFKKITSKYPQMKSWSDSETDQAMGLVAAMGYCFSVAKSEKPTTRYGGDHWITAATAFANSARIPAPRIRSVLIGIIACHDVNYTLSNSDLYLDTFGRGAPISREAWRRLLNGAPVREPMAVREKQLDGSIGMRKQIPSW
jgi:hypothetical protein